MSPRLLKGIAVVDVFRLMAVEDVLVPLLGGGACIKHPTKKISMKHLKLYMFYIQYIRI